MNALITMSNEKLGSVNAIALHCADHLLLPVVTKLLPRDEEWVHGFKYCELPESLPSSEEYYAEQLSEAEAWLDVLEARTTEEIEDAGRVERGKYEEARAYLNAKAGRRRDVCRDALHEAEGWQPPSPRHEELKRVMVSELKAEIDRCRLEAVTKYLLPLSSQAQHDDWILRAKQAIERYRERAKTVVPEIKRWNVWLRELHEACPAPGPEQESPAGERSAETT